MAGGGGDRDSVWFSVEAVSRPAALLPWLTYPLVRWLQAEFRAQAGAAVGREVAAARGRRRRRRGKGDFLF